MLAIARRLSPDLMTQALETEAKRARVGVVGSFDDPTVQITSDEIDRPSGARQNKMIYNVQQEIPLWGKLDLRQAIASADVQRQQANARSTEAELIERVKVAFARYYQTTQAIESTKDLHRTVHDIAAVARDRYAQGRGTQPEVYRAEIEDTKFTNELVMLEAQLVAARGQLNVLLVRPIDAPLTEPKELRSLPPEAALNPTMLIERARSGSPRLAMAEADISASESDRTLAGKSWYPEVTLGGSVIDRGENGPTGYQAMIALKVPLQWGLHEAQEHEAAARASAARTRLQSADIMIQSAIAEATASLAGSRQSETLLRTRLLPQTDALVRSGTAAYGIGKGDLNEVLRSQHDFVDIRLQLLAIQFDEQRQLAAIERLIGEDL